MFPANECPLCNREARLFQDVNARVECAGCGNFRIARRFYDTTLRPDSITAETKDLLPYLSAHTRQSSERGEEVVLDDDNWKAYAQSHENIPVARRLERLLELMAARAKPGLPVKFDDKTDPALVDAARGQELSWMLENLVEIEYVTRVGNWSYTVKPKGWEKIQSSTVSGIPGKCFVAMSFDPSMNDAFTNGIESAVKIDCKMDAVRIDKKHHNEKICDKIIAEIRTCQFLVADVSAATRWRLFRSRLRYGLGATRDLVMSPGRLKERFISTPANTTTSSGKNQRI